MRFPFEERRAAQAAAFILHRHGGRMNYTALLKLLYLADRLALVECGQPITGDRMVSMPHGPVLSLIYERISMGPTEGVSPWFEYVSERVGYDVELVGSSSELNELSEYFKGVLIRVDEKHGMLDWRALIRLVHRLPEWRDPDGSMIPIDPAEILTAERKSPEEIERIAQDAEEASFFRSLETRSR